MSLRAHWTSRTAFVLAAIGSAVGLGNLIRFPYICSRYGGGAFLLAYVVALLTAGLPIMILEFGLGHISEGSAPKAFRKIHPKLEWLGWIAAGVGFVIVVYYSVIMAWSFNFLIDSFSITSWAGNAKEHFHNVLGFDAAQKMGNGDINAMPFVWTGFKPMLLVGLAVTWVAVVASVWKGATTVSKVVYATVLVPWLILIIFVIRAVTLPGAAEGLKMYLSPNWKMLLNGEMWLAAYTQVFFSLSIGFGIMIAYASFLPKKSDLVKNAVIICIADSLTAFVAGLAVFACMGHLAHEEAKSIAELDLAGLKLTFITYPVLISKLRGAAFFGMLFYLMILTLGVDSAFSLLESFASAVRDKWNISHRKANLIVGGLGLALGLPLVSGAGLLWVDTIDYFMTHYGLALVVLIECVVVADIYGCRRLCGHLNEVSEWKVGALWDIMVMAIAPAALLVFLTVETIQRWEQSYEGYPRKLEFLGGWLILILLPIVGRALQAIPWAKQLEEQTVPETFEGT